MGGNSTANAMLYSLYSDMLTRGWWVAAALGRVPSWLLLSGVAARLLLRIATGAWRRLPIATGRRLTVSSRRRLTVAWVRHVCPFSLEHK